MLPLTSRNGWGSTLPPRTTRIFPVCSRTKSRRVSPGGAVTKTGWSNLPIETRRSLPARRAVWVVWAAAGASVRAGASSEEEPQAASATRAIAAATGGGRGGGGGAGGGERGGG